MKISSDATNKKRNTIQSDSSLNIFEKIVVATKNETTKLTKMKADGVKTPSKYFENKLVESLFLILLKEKLNKNSPNVAKKISNDRIPDA
jgi:hypothetical protein